MYKNVRPRAKLRAPVRTVKFRGTKSKTYSRTSKPKSKSVQSAVSFRRSYPRRHTRRYRHRGTRMSRYMGNNPTNELIPDAFYTTLQWSAGDVITNSTAFVEEVFRINSINDCYAAVGGPFRPAGYTQYAAFYQKYQVYGCMVQVEAVVQTAGQSILVGIGAGPDASSSYNDMFDVMDDAEFHTKQAIYGTPFKMKRYFPINKVFGVPKSQSHDDPLFSAVLTSNPTSTAFCYLNHRGFDITTPTAYSLRWKLKYYVRLFQRVEVTQPTPMVYTLDPTKSPKPLICSSDDESETSDVGTEMTDLTKSDFKSLKDIIKNIKK